MKTCLYDKHVRLGAKMINFYGWEMPIQYKGIIQEHLTVRQKVGLFDISHMGRILVEGSDAEQFLDYLSTNNIAGKKDLTATYTVWCTSQGTCLDDLMVYKIDSTHFFVIVNASNREKDLQHLIKESAPYKVNISPLFADGILAIQGPLADSLIKKIFSSGIPSMHFLPLQYMNSEIILSATGYTGAGGYEIFGPSTIISNLWDQLLQEGQGFGIQPIGLGARDTLRLEKGYALYGYELSENIFASETVSAWTIKWEKPSFLGKEPLERLEKSLKKQYEYGMILVGKGIAREGYPVFKKGKAIGRVTSGTYSPSLNRAIAIILSQEKLEIGEILDLQIRQHLIPAEVVKLPFI